jgi:hypothetical protein
MAHVAEEARNVPLLVQRRDALGHDGLVAPTALWRKHVVVILLAVRLSVVLHEPAAGKPLSALRAEKVVKVPRLAQRRDCLTL